MDAKMLAKILINNEYGGGITGKYGPKIEYVDTDSMGIKEEENV